MSRTKGEWVKVSGAGVSRNLVGTNESMLSKNKVYSQACSMCIRKILWREKVSRITLSSLGSVILIKFTLEDREKAGDAVIQSNIQNELKRKRRYMLNIRFLSVTCITIKE